MKVVFFNVFVQAMYFVVSVFVAGFLISLINRLFYRTVKGRAVCYATGLIGTPVHELSHAVMCILFGHKITEIRLFQIDTATGVLGYVNHSYNKRNVYQRLGNYFIGVAPIVCGTALVFLVVRFLLPETFLALRGYLSEFAAMQGEGSFGEIVVRGVKAFGKMFGAFFSEAFSNYKWWIFILFAFCIALHMNLSGADVKSAVSALPALFIAALVVNFAVALISGSAYAAFTAFLAKTGCCLIGVLLLSLTLSLLTLAVGAAVRGIVVFVSSIKGKG